MNGDLVPFGKHKGQPVDVLLADPGYREWILAQPWVRDKYPTFHQTIINYGGEPSETPEHNQMQASFLDDGHCLALARLLYAEELFDGRAALGLFRQAWDKTLHFDDAMVDVIEEHTKAEKGKPQIWARKFEAEGWDVVFDLHPTGLWFELRSLPGCSCACNHEHDCPASSSCRGGEKEHDCRHRYHDKRTLPPTIEWYQAANFREIEEFFSDYRAQSYRHCDDKCLWRNARAVKWLLDGEECNYTPSPKTVRVECKPDLGDDFPAVLRQVTRYNADRFDRRCVIVRRHAFEHVTWEQVLEMFRASGIWLLDEARLVKSEEVAA